jgi:hypothetical protein
VAPARPPNDVDQAALPPHCSLHERRPEILGGRRVPHLWLRNDCSLDDTLGADYTLMRFDPTVGVSGIVAAASSRGVPLAVLDVDAPRDGRNGMNKFLSSRS